MKVANILNSEQTQIKRANEVLTRKTDPRNTNDSDVIGGDPRVIARVQDNIVSVNSGSPREQHTGAQDHLYGGDDAVTIVVAMGSRQHS